MREPASKIDESVKIPAAVKAAAARAEELHRLNRGEGDQPQDADPNAAPNDPQASADRNEGHTPVTPEGNLAEPGSAQPTPKSDANPDAKPDTTAKADGVKADGAKADDGETWEHKYKSVHGRLLRQTRVNEDLQRQIDNLQSVISTMQTPNDPTPSAETIAESLLTPEEIADYGDDFLKVVGKKARQEVAPLIKGYQDKIAELEAKLSSVEEVTVQTATERMKSKMDAELPNWRTLNTDPAFLEWLSLPDAYSGVIRHDMLRAAYSQGDAPRTLAFFKGFLAQEAAVAPAEAKPDTRTTTVPKVPLADLAAPGRAKTAASDSTPAEKPIITRDQISLFYADVAAGKYRGREADKKATEDQIFAAQREGRIR